MEKPTLFIGSSSECLEIVKAIEGELRDIAYIERWDVDSFRPGHFTLEELIRTMKEVDFAIFVLGQEDSTVSRGKSLPSPRDNVIFEAGLFTAILGRKRTFYVVDKAGTKIPSDWDGLGYTVFDNTEKRPRDKVYDAVVKIRKEISEWKPHQELGGLLSIVGRWWQYVINTEEAAVMSLITFYATHLEDLRLEGDSWAVNGKRMANYKSQCADFDKKTTKVFYSWKGSHPRGDSLPVYFGIGEVSFKKEEHGVAPKAEGWFSTSNMSDIKGTLTKYVILERATPDELMIFDHGEHHEKEKLINSKLERRKQL